MSTRNRKVINANEWDGLATPSFAFAPILWLTGISPASLQDGQDKNNLKIILDHKQKNK